ncbi:MAG: hypothetical protein R3B54_16770 [Bdellovibrionota bacterium]
MVDLNTSGEDPETRDLRNEAARSFLETFFNPNAKDGGILGRATSKDISSASRWKEFGLRDTGYQALRSLNDLRKQDDVSDLRGRAFGESPSQSARDEIVRRVNQDSKADPLGGTLRSDFKSTRPDLLLAEEQRLIGDLGQSAESFAHLLGASNSAALQELARTPTPSENKEQSLYQKRLACAAAISLKSRDSKATPDIDKNCENLQDFKSAFESALKKDTERYQLYQNWIEAAKDPAKLQAARDWMLDPKKSGYQEENLMDRLGERVQSALDSRLPQKERQAAFDEATVLAKILGHQDPTTNDWSLDLVAKDAGLASQIPSSQTLILGQGEEIFAALARFSKRDTDNHVAETATRFGTRTRFQSFSRDRRSHAEHLADKKTRIFYAPDGEDKKNQLGTGTVSGGQPTHIGKRASLLPAGLENPPRVPATDGDLTAQVEAVLNSATCVQCHVAQSTDSLKSFFASSGLDGKMPSGPSLAEALVREPENLAILKRYLEGDAR